MDTIYSTKTSFNYKPFGIMFFFVIVFVAIWYLITRKVPPTTFMNKAVVTTPNLTATPTTTPVPSVKLPSGWTVKNIPGYEYRAVRTSQQAIKPVINLVKIKKNSDDDDKTFVNKQIKGAKSAYTTFTITKDSVKDIDGFYVRELEGSYMNGTTKVALAMNLYVKNDIMYILTGAHDSKDKSVVGEMEQVFTSIYTTKIIK